MQVLVDELYSDDPGHGRLQPDIAGTFAELDRFAQKGRIVVFEEGGIIVGYAILIFFWSNEYCGDVIEIDELLVERARRKKGIGAQFFKWLEEEYAPHCVGFSLQVSQANMLATHIYEREGFQLSQNTHFLKLL